MDQAQEQNSNVQSRTTLYRVCSIYIPLPHFLYLG